MNRNSTRSVQRTPPLHAGPRAIPMQDSSSQLNRGGGGYRGRHADSDGEGAGVAAGASSATAGGGGDDGNDMSDDNYSPPVRGPPGRGRGRQVRECSWWPFEVCACVCACVCTCVLLSPHALCIRLNPIEVRSTRPTFCDLGMGMYQLECLERALVLCFVASFPMQCP